MRRSPVLTPPAEWAFSVCAGLAMEPGREPWSQFDCRCRLLVVLLISIAMKAGANQVREGYDRQHADLPISSGPLPVCASPARLSNRTTGASEYTPRPRTK